ncbi:MAG: two-component system phosphate regulon sensor histidine kinase PhoR [Crocinitomix sp.]|jgi:two-component system phosphate regulon sensor histidine kinase PhoR
MRTRTIPVLITAMTLALIGIVFIQFKWIEQSLVEKRKLVDHKVHQLVANVEQRMSDFNSLAYLASTPELNTLFQERLMELDHNKFDTIPEDDSLRITYYHDFEGGDTVTQNTQVEIRIVKGDSLTYTSEIAYFGDQDSIQQIFENSQNLALQVQLHDINDVFERILFEVNTDIDDIRLDSIAFKNELFSETAALGLENPNDWGIYNKMTESFVIQPIENNEWDYQIPLFEADILNPGRYMLYINMSANNESVWQQIYFMIILSLLFIGIIGFVFIYSIRLVIKHKKISNIKSDFINNMTHEFKTPLASISLAADSIIHPEVREDTEKVQAFIEIIKAEKDKLIRHIETILEVASLKKNDVDIALTRMDVNEGINESIEKLSLLIDDRNCVVNLNLDQHLFVNANAYHLENVFSNVIENSIKYSPDQPKIEVTSAIEGNKVRIKIKDAGIGMSKEQVSKAFDNFYRAQKGNIHNTKGFGLGLSFVKYMVFKMKGTIRIESELNVGTTVIIEFPLCH